MVEQNGQLPSHRDNGLAPGLFTASSCEVQAPLSKCRISPMWSQDVVGALDQQASEIDVPSLGDAELWVMLARLAASRSQAEIASDIPASLESFLVAQSKYE